MAQTTTVIDASSKAARRASSVGQTTRVGVARASIPATASGVCVSISHRPYRARLVGMCATDNRLFRSPYPDENGEPYKTLFNNATTRQPGSTPHTNATAGMSLIGDFAMARTVGLVATSHAAPKAMTSDSALRPNAKVAHTSRP